MLYLVIRKDGPDGERLRLENRDAHIKFALGLTEKVKAGGPLMREGDPARTIGSAFILEGESKAEVEAIIDRDPYVAAGVYASTEVTAWALGIGDWLPKGRRLFP